MIHRRTTVPLAVALAFAFTGVSVAADPQPVFPAEDKGGDQNELHAPPGRVKANARRPTGKLALISSITRAIEEEARDGWLADRKWPRDDADFSSRTETGLTDRQLIQALLKRQHNHPSLDGYVRWQLLSFAPDLSEAKPIELRRMVGAMPGLVRLPTPPQPTNIFKGDGTGGGGYIFVGTQKAFVSDLRPIPGTPGLAAPTLGVVSTGTGLGAAYTDPEDALVASRSAAYDYVKTRPLIERLNTPSIRFRDAFVRMLPRAEGLRLEAMFIDLKERIEAGDPDWKRAAQAFFDEAFQTRNDDSIDAKKRLELVNDMKALGARKVYVLDDIKIDNAGNVRVAKSVVQFPRERLGELLTWLAGP